MLKQQYPAKHKANLKLFFSLPRGLSASFLTGYVGRSKWEVPTQQGDYAEAITKAHTRSDGRMGYLLENQRLELFAAVYNMWDTGNKEYPFGEGIRRRIVGGINYSY